MPINFLPKELVGATLMQISDIHVGDRFDYHFILDSFVKAQKLQPDYVVYTGDFISYKKGYDYNQLKEVMQSTVKGRLGTLGILGNHDYGINWAEQSVADNVSQILTDGGIGLLENSSQESNGLNFIGLDDYYGPNFEPNSIMSSLIIRRRILSCAIIQMCVISMYGMITKDGYWLGIRMEDNASHRFSTLLSYLSKIKNTLLAKSI
jgi:predicted MPP superfamily phosphohydrolase